MPIFVVFGLHDFSSWTAQNWLDYTLTSRPVVRLEVHGVSPKGRRRSMMGRVCETDRFYAENEKSEVVMDDENGESTAEDAVAGLGESQIERVG